jgi:hypothetical protein
MSEDSVPEITRNTHLLFRADNRVMDESPSAPDLRCVLCRQGGAELGCERCGTPMHADCHLAQAASAGERAIFHAGVEEITVGPRAPLAIDGQVFYRHAAPGPAEQAVERLTYLCPWCRS